MAECINGRGEDHVVTHGPECFYCGQIPTKPFETMRAALEAIQELHKPVWTAEPFPGGYLCGVCDIMLLPDPCPTWMLADGALTDNLARTTKNGENNE